MVTVFIPALLRPLTAGADRVTLSARTVREAVEELEVRHPGLRARLLQEDELRPGMRVSVDGLWRDDGLRARLEPDSELHFIPAIGGG